MKKIYFFAIALLMQSIASAQTETEPNNSFQHANIVPTYPTTVTASIGNGDSIDYFKPEIDFELSYYKNGNINLTIEATNTSAAGSHFLKAEMFNSLHQAGMFYSENISPEYVPAGATVTKDFRVCGQSLDSIYFAITSNGSFDYNFYFYIGDPQQDTEPNNTRSQAMFFDQNIITAQSIRYLLNGISDTVDHFKTILQPGAYTTATLNLEAKNTSCENDQWMRYELFRNNSSTPFASGYAGNEPLMYAYQTVNSDIPLNGMQPGDSLFIKITASGPYGYGFTLKDLPVDHADAEDNCCTYNALDLPENTVVGGNVGEYDVENGYTIDEYDTYKFTLTQAGAIQLYIKGTNLDCDPGDYYLYYDLLNEYGNEISSYNELIHWSYPSCDEEKNAIVKVRGFNAGTYYIRLHTYSSYSAAHTNYELLYSFTDATDNVDAEYNSTVAEATVAVPGETYKGNVQFKGLDYDPIDYYKTVMPADGQMTVTLKTIYRDENRENQSYAAFSYSVNGSNYTHRTPTVASVPELIADNIYLDTFQVCGLAGGEVVFGVFSGYAFEYELSYVFTDTTTWQNDPEPNNSKTAAPPLLQSAIQQGHVGYFTDGTRDGIDYYRIITPVDGNLKIYVEATNTSCNNGTYLNLRVNDRTNFSAGVSFSKHVGNNDNILAGQTIFDTISVCSIAADTNFISLEVPGTEGQYRYSLRYELTDTSTGNDAEPNNSFALATLVQPGTANKGLTGYRKDGSADNFDYYKIYIATSDTLRVSVTAKNTGCGNNALQFNCYNKNLSQVLSRNVGNNPAVPSLQTVTDVIKLFVTAPDTIYMRLYSADGFRYSLTTNPQPPSSAFYMEGDSTPCTGTTVYTARGVVDDNVQYHWSLPQGGGTVTHIDSVATVVWTENATRKLSLYLSNDFGNSATKTMNVLISGIPPTQVPLVFDFARSLSVETVPPGAYCQWFRNDVLIAGAVEPLYYAALAGAYTVKYYNDCGPGPVSNSKTYAADAIAQTISLPHTDTLSMSPALKVTLPGTASSGLAVSYHIISGPGTVAYDTLRISGAGTVIIKASQKGNDIYSPAAEVPDTIIVKKGSQVIAFDSIPTLYFNSTSYYPAALSTSGLGVRFSIVSGNATISSNGLRLDKAGAGAVTVRATQTGNNDYNAAAPVERTFCISLNALSVLTGEVNPCLATYRYHTQKITGAGFVWTLSSGGILTTHNDTAWVQWQTPGNHTLKVKAVGSCDTAYTNELTMNISTSNSAPDIVTNMLPGNNARDQQLPLTLSWIPGSHTITYDLYIWDSAQAQPATPYAAGISTVSYVLPLNSFAYNTTYKWRLVSKNPCSQTIGPVQHFRLIPLPDLVMSNVQAPASANSGQTVTISWTVTNAGPGRTLTTQHWTDGVFFSFTPVLNTYFPPLTNPHLWSNLVTENYPLLLATKPNVTALESGQSYSNTVNFTLPENYSQPVYVYAVTNYPKGAGAPLQLTVINDSAFAAQPMQINLSPTPDLRVDSVFTPISSFSGSAVNLSYKVKNYGALTPAGKNWTDSIFISQNPLFDRQQCIPVSLRDSKDRYYPNTINAYTSNSTQLQTDSSYSRSLEVVLPNNIFGTWFVYVQANANTKSNLYEGAFAGNNVNKSQLQLYLTPTPQLVVQDFSLPVTQASVTQPIGVNWNIKNEGFTDNIEKNQGHYLNTVNYFCPCYSSIPGSDCVGLPVYNDSTSFGSSYWIDRVYLSTNPNGLDVNNAVLLNEVKHGVKQFSGMDYYFFNTCDLIATRGAHNVATAIKPNGSYPGSLNFKIPSNLAEGNYYVYVYTNPTKTVFEYPGTAQIKRSAQPVSIQRPDVLVSSVTAPAAVTGGAAFNINYTINNNSPAAVYNHIRRDRIYVSNFSSFDGSAELVAANTYTEDVPAGVSVTHSFTHTFAGGTSGARYFYVETNYDSAFRETNYSNNFNIAAGATTLVTAALPGDLYIASSVWPDTVYTMKNNLVKFTVKNSGTGAASGSWKDSIFVTCGSTFNRANSIFLAERIQNRLLLPDSSYTDSFYFEMRKYAYELNTCFPATGSSTAYFFIKTNADTAAYESSAIHNNLSSGMAKVLTNSLVDHIVTSVTAAADTATVGRPLQVSYTLQNIGYNPPYNYYTGYYDGIFISPDSVYNGNAVLASQFLHYGVMNRYATLNYTKQAIMPNVSTGDYYLIVRSNSLGSIKGELVLNNNFNVVRDAGGGAKKMHIIRPLLPDLRDSIVFATPSVAVGQPITLIRKISNTGEGPTYPNSYANELFLSPDFNLDYNFDPLVSAKVKNAVLAAGASYVDTITAVIRISTIPGNYILLDAADRGGVVTELNETNNYAYSNLTVYSPPESDLFVENIIHPDTVLLGYTMDTAKWVVQNNSPNQALGISSDGIYLSVDKVPDSTDVLLQVKNKHIDLAPLASDTVRLAPMVRNITEGNYHVIVRTDLLNNIIESDKTNNSTTSAKQVYVKVKELKFNVTENNTLLNNSRYYKLVIPDSLLGATIRVRLKSADSLTVRNEMYIAGNYVPTAFQYDYRFETPNYGNQDIIISSVTAPVYYIMFNAPLAGSSAQQVTLNAEVLPFAILNVNSNRGGNIGNVTVKLSGSLFTDSMTATISKAGTTITASQVYFTNSTVVYATFNLQGKPLGVYDVSLAKTDNSITTVPAAFTIEAGDNGGLITGSGSNTGSGNGNEPGCDPGAPSGLNSQLVVELVVPEKALIYGRPLLLQINYTNPTNYDIPAQSRTLYSEAGMKLSFTKAGVPDGTTALYMELTEPGGPPGIIRAGGSGTITVYTTTPNLMPESHEVVFKLK